MEVIYNLPEHEYHDGSHFGIHALADIKKCGPLGFYNRHILKLGDGHRYNQAALDLGRAAHCLILEGEEEFYRRFAVRPDEIDGQPWHGNRKVCKEWLAESKKSGVTILSNEDYDKCFGMLDSIDRTFVRDEYLSNGKPEVSIRGEIIGIPVQCRVDWLQYGMAVRFVDLKTIDNIDNAAKHIRNYGYRAQAGFYVTLGDIAFHCVPSWVFIFVEKQSPYRIAVVNLDDEALDKGAADAQEYLSAVKHHLDLYGTDSEWPQEVQQHTIGLAPWERNTNDT